MSGLRFTSIIVLCLVVIRPLSAQEDPLLNTDLAARYGLQVPSPREALDPAPQWLRDADMFMGASISPPWMGHRFMLRDTLVSRIVRARAGHRRMDMTVQYPVETVAGLDGASIRGVTMLTHVPHSREAFRLARDHGFKAIPYVHFMGVHTNYADY